MIRISAFAWVQPFAQGYVRDLRLRWALEEAGIPYEVRRVDRAARASAEYRALQPFGQVPSYEEDGLVLFESGAIVLHIAERSEALLPAEAGARARAITWLFAALNTVEPPIVEREAFMLLERDKGWYDQRLAMLDANVRSVLGELSRFLGDRIWLEDEFTAGDLMMVAVLRRLEDGPNLVAEYPNLFAYVARGEARPAFARAFRAQAAVFERSNA